MTDQANKNSPTASAGKSASAVALLYAFIASLWIFFSSWLLDMALTDKSLLGLVELLKGIAFVAVTAWLLRALLRGRLAPAALAPPALATTDHPSNTKLSILIVALLLLVPLITISILSFYSPRLQRETHAELAAVAQLKSAQLELWMKERLQDVSAISSNPSFIDNLNRFRGDGDADAAQRLRNQLVAVHGAYHYRDAAIIDAQGHVLLASSPRGDSAPLAILASLQELPGPGSSELYRDSSGTLLLDVINRVDDDAGSYLLLRGDPERFILPQIMTWPGDSPTASITLLSRQPDQIREIAHTGTTHFSASHSQALAEALTGRNQGQGILTLDMENGSTRYVAFQQISNTPWLLATSVDASEALQPVRELAMLVSAILLATLLVITAMLATLWRQQRQAHTLTLKLRADHYEASLQQQAQTYQEIFAGNPHPMWIFDCQTMRFLAVNHAAELEYGYQREEFLRMDVRQIRSPEEAKRLDVRVADRPKNTIVKGGIWRHRRRDGSELDVEISCHPLTFEGRESLLVLAYDVTEREQLERRLRQSEDAIRATIDALPLQISVLDASGAFQMTNRLWDEYTAENVGRRGEMVVGASYPTILQQSSEHGNAMSKTLLEGVNEVIGGRRNVYEMEYPHVSGGKVVWFLVRIQRFPDDSDARLVLSHEDITERKLADMEARKLQRYYAALTNMSNAIIRNLDGPEGRDRRQQILDEICRIAAHHGELALVWVAKLAQDEDLADLLAYSGRAVDFLREYSGNPSLKTLTLQGAIRDAVIQQQSHVIHCTQRHPGSSARYRELTGKWQLHSVLACPIVIRGKVWGAITFYADSTNYFSPDLIHLLEQLTEELAYSLDIVDIEQRRAEAEAQLLLNARVIESSHEGMFITNERGRLIMANAAMSTITGYSNPELLGLTPHALSADRPGHSFLKAVANALKRQGHWEGETYHRRKNGDVFPVGLSITRVESREGTHHIAIYRDLSERKEYENRIAHMISHDALTDLPNRSLFDARMSDAIKRMKTSKNQKLAVLFIDIDRFKMINESLGHGTGDRLISEVATRIVECCGDPRAVCRVAGDEFAVLLSHVDDDRHISRLAAEIVSRVSSPCRVNDTDIVVTVSVGVAVYPDHGVDTATLAKNANTAMVHAKRSGRNHHRLYTSTMEKDIGQHIAFENALRNAISNRELTLAYQPQINLITQEIVGVEALARWHHSEYGDVSPGTFIPVAERSGMIIELGNWALQEACEQAMRWRQRQQLQVPVSVNVSFLQLCQDNFVRQVRRVLNATGLPANMLELEITESLLMQDVDRTLDKLNALAALGVQLAIDDFGTGYSSLAYLRQFPANRLKIDKSFVRDLPDSHDAASIVNAIIDLASNLGMRTIAEGIENTQQLQMLAQSRCLEGQGYLIARPISAAELEQWLSERQAAPSSRQRLG